MEGWVIGIAANGVIAVAFLAVAVLLGYTALSTGQWRRNPLGIGTFFLYVGCGGGHAVHFLQLVGPSVGIGVGVGLSVRAEYGEWHPWAIDVLTAFAGVWYWTMRRRFPALVSGVAVFEDLRDRQKRALEIHDNVVQGLARAKLALELGEDADGKEAVAETLVASRRIMTQMIAPERAGERTGAGP